VRAAAYAFARLADPSGVPEPRRSALRRIFAAMTSHPDMVEGPGGFDTELMIAGRGTILTKRGAEGYQAIALLPGTSSKFDSALGITLKISDGDLSARDRGVPGTHIAHAGGGRAVSTSSTEVLRQLGALDETQLAELKNYLPRAQYNWRHIEVGQIRACFELFS
jgi:L-asparaginase II